MKNQSLGRLERVDLRTIWKNEPKQFTPWLAREENLEILGEALGLRLECKAVERGAGSFRADIVCRDIDSDTGDEASVLIENQLERTDHDHLGKLLTYAAVLQTVTVVWLAESFRDEHRAALDWLNEITHEKASFFGLEIELWRIGKSPAAPKFNIVSMPNDWSRSVTLALDGAKQSETKLKQLEYWCGLQVVLDDTNEQVAGKRKPQAKHWMDYPIGRTGFHLAASVNSRARYIRVDLYISGEEAKQRLRFLEQQKDEIERELGLSLEWGDESPTARDSRIACYCRDVDPDDKSDWPRQHRWLAKHLNDMHRAFARRVGEL